jgi:hypothetical protein
LKGWQGFPLGDVAKGFDLGVILQQTPLQKDTSKNHAVIGIMPAKGKKIKVAQGDKVFLAQEIRNFRAGHYTLTIDAMVGGSSKEHFDQYFKPNFTCKLVIYRNADATKNALLMKPAELMEFKPEYAEAPDFKTQKFVLAKLMDSRVPNVNFSVGLGFGIAVMIEKQNMIPENTPHSIASGIIYFVACMCHLPISKKDVNRVSDMSEVTINKCYKKMEAIKTQLVPSCMLREE